MTSVPGVFNELGVMVNFVGPCRRSVECINKVLAMFFFLKEVHKTQWMSKK